MRERLNKGHESRIVRRMRRTIHRVRVEHLLRSDDETAAYYCPESDEIIMFYDVIMKDALIHFRAWASGLEQDLESFAMNFVVMRTLHELFHACDIESSKQCEYLAVKLIYGSEEIARMEANWMYPCGKIQRVPEVTKE